MSNYVCPINNRPCRCDPNALKLNGGVQVPDEKFRPCMLAKRIGVLVRLMGSNFEGEAIGAVTGLRRLLPSEGLTFNDLAILIENCNGAIEEKKYSDEDAAIYFHRGEAKGRAEEARKQTAPPEFYDADGQPRWYEIAVFCQQNSDRLRSEWERNFANDIPGKVIKYGAPTERQIPRLLAIFVQLGGRYDPKTIHVHR